MKTTVIVLVSVGVAVALGVIISDHQQKHPATGGGGSAPPGSSPGSAPGGNGTFASQFDTYVNDATKLADLGSKFFGWGNGDDTSDESGE